MHFLCVVDINVTFWVIFTESFGSDFVYFLIICLKNVSGLKRGYLKKSINEREG